MSGGAVYKLELLPVGRKRKYLLCLNGKECDFPVTHLAVFGTCHISMREIALLLLQHWNDKYLATF